MWSNSQVRLQAQYGPNPKRLRDIVGEMYAKYGWRQGIFRGYWVSLIDCLSNGRFVEPSRTRAQITFVREIPAYAGAVKSPPRALLSLTPLHGQAFTPDTNTRSARSRRAWARTCQCGRP